MPDQIASLVKEPAIFQLGLPPGNGGSSCADCCVAMIVRHETGHAVTAEKVRQASGNTDVNTGLTPGQCLNALVALGVRGYAYHAGVSASEALKATADGLVIVGVNYGLYPSMARAEIGGKTDLGFAGPHSMLIAGYRYWATKPAADAWGRAQIPFQPGWRSWGRDPDHRQGWAWRYDRYATSYLSRAMAGLVGCGSPPWQSTFMIAKDQAKRLTAMIGEGMGYDTPIDQPGAPAPTVTLKLGRKEPYPEAVKPRLYLGTYLTAVPAPASADFYSAVPVWGVMLNDQVGDCTCAAVGHMIESVSTYGQGQEVTVRDADVLTAYEAVGGYVPGNPSTDQGANIQDVLGYWRRTGVAGSQCLGFAQVDVAKQDEVRQACYIFGSLHLGLGLPKSAMDEFDAAYQAGTMCVWDVVPNDGGILGGHAIEMVGYDAVGPYAVTWGVVVHMTWAFFAAYVDEAWAVIQKEWLNAQGNDPQNLNVQQLGQDLATITGNGNPIPAPIPVPPTPTPTPAPTPKPTPAGCGTTTALLGILALLAVVLLGRS